MAQLTSADTPDPILSSSSRHTRHTAVAPIDTGESHPSASVRAARGAADEQQASLRIGEQHTRAGAVAASHFFSSATAAAPAARPMAKTPHEGTRDGEPSGEGAIEPAAK